MNAASLETDLKHITSLASCDDSEHLISALAKALKHKSSFVVAKAAHIVAQKQITELSDDLINAFNRMAINPIKRDPGCKAKLAIVDSMRELVVIAESVYFKAAQFKQLEPVWGGREDTAGDLRCAGVAGLIMMGHSQTLNLIAALLSDSQRECRMGAAQLCASLGDPAIEPMLRLRVLSGEKDTDVINEIFTAIILVGESQGLEFVAQYLNDPDHPDFGTCAALAIGNAKLPAGLPILIQQFERELDQSLRETLLLAMAMLRIDEANSFICEQICEADHTTAQLAIRAIGIYYYDPAIKQLVLDAAKDRDDLEQVLNDVFM